MADYRDPKVTSTGKKSGGMGRWLGIAAAVIILLLLLAWLLGWFGGQEVETVEPTVIEEPAATEGAEVVEDGEADTIVVEEEADVVE